MDADTYAVSTLRDRLAVQIKRAELAEANGLRGWAAKYRRLADRTRAELEALGVDDHAAGIIAGYGNPARLSRTR